MASALKYAVLRPKSPGDDSNEARQERQDIAVVDFTCELARNCCNGVVLRNMYIRTGWSDQWVQVLATFGSSVSFKQVKPTMVPSWVGNVCEDEGGFL